MTFATSTPASRVVTILTKAGFQLAPSPLLVASVPFDFAAALVGVGRAPDLIVVINTVTESELRIRQKVDSLGRALDVAGSRRPLTVVLVGPKPSDPTLEAVGRVARVLPVGTPTGTEGEALLQDWLAILLPLELPDPNRALADPRAELIAQLSEDLDKPLRKALLAAAENGPKAVEQALKRSLEAVLSEVESLAGDAT